MRSSLYGDPPRECRKKPLATDTLPRQHSRLFRRLDSPLVSLGKPIYCGSWVAASPEAGKRRGTTAGGMT